MWYKLDKGITDAISGFDRSCARRELGQKSSHHTRWPPLIHVVLIGFLLFLSASSLPRMLNGGKPILQSPRLTGTDLRFCRAPPVAAPPASESRTPRQLSSTTIIWSN